MIIARNPDFMNPNINSKGAQLRSVGGSNMI